MGVVFYNKLVYSIICITTPCFHCTPLWWNHQVLVHGDLQLKRSSHREDHILGGLSIKWINKYIYSVCVCVCIQIYIYIYDFRAADLHACRKGPRADRNRREPSSRESTAHFKDLLNRLHLRVRFCNSRETTVLTSEPETLTLLVPKTISPVMKLYFGSPVDTYLFSLRRSLRGSDVLWPQLPVETFFQGAKLPPSGETRA